MGAVFIAACVYDDFIWHYGVCTGFNIMKAVALQLSTCLPWRVLFGEGGGLGALCSRLVTLLLPRPGGEVEGAFDLAWAPVLSIK